MYLSALMIGAIISGQHKLLEELKNAPNIVKSVIQNSESIIKKINSVSDFQNIFFLGSGPLYGIACEATLKMMEMTISNTISVPFLESRHGPRSLIDEKSLVIGLYSNAGIGYEAKVMDELTLNHNATTVALNPNSEWETGNCTYKISINSKWPDYILGLAYLPVIQLLAFYRAMAKGVNPDTSRYLTQYIEIEKV
jgi:glucosamine--fructose-6-phosphate aminotransferase (isomerizing)